MKLGTVRLNGAERVVIALDDEKAVPLNSDVTMDGLIRDWTAARTALSEPAQRGRGETGPIPVSGLEWLPPVPRPGKVICVALNNSANVDRIITGPKKPATFIKPSSSLLGNGQTIRLRPQYGRVHPEPELAVVIGLGGSDLSVDTALDHVFGYTILNDLTSPTMRAEDTFHYRAIHPGAGGSQEISYVDTWVTYPGRYKGSDGFGPIGPWIATADTVPDPHDLTVSCTHEGAIITEDSTANLLHKVADIISYMSEYMTLDPGDSISMGTALKPSEAQGSAIQNVDLNKLGGRIEVTISGIGTLSNPVALR